MKKTLLPLLAAFVLFNATFANAQGLYVRAGLGYGIGATGEILGPKVTLTDNNAIYGNTYGALGGGLNVQAGLGYMFNKHFGIQLEAFYLHGSTVTLEEATRGDEYDRSETYTRQIRLIPALVVDAGFEKVSPYARFGVVIPAAGTSYGERESNAPSLISAAIPLLFPEAAQLNADATIKGKFTVGFQPVIGLNYNIGNRLAIFGEVQYTGVRITRKSYEVTRAELTMNDGSTQDVLNLLAIVNDASNPINPTNVYEYIEYYDEIDMNELEAYMLEAQEAAANDPDANTYYGTKKYPAKLLEEDSNYSSIGLTVGVKFSFGKNKAEN